MLASSVLHAFFLVLIPFTNAKQYCRHQPGDAGWPTDTEWTTLNSTLDGRLIPVQPSGKVCRLLNCTDAEWGSALFRNDIPGQMLEVGTCTSCCCSSDGLQWNSTTGNKFVIIAIVLLTHLTMPCSPGLRRRLSLSPRGTDVQARQCTAICHQRDDTRPYTSKSISLQLRFLALSNKCI